MAELDNRAVGVGLALGAGVGATASVIVGGDLAQGTGYGIAVGIIVGTILARLAPRVTDGDHPTLALVTGGAILGLAVGGLVGIVAAWSVDAAITTGMSVGGAAGAVLGLLLASVLALSNGENRVPETSQTKS